MQTRILHLSDLHIGRTNEEEQNFKLIVKYILDKGENEWQNNKPLILITGDIVDDGAETQYIVAVGHLNKLHNAGFPLRIIPGNHDYGENGNHATIENFNLFKKYFARFHEMEFPHKKPINDHIYVGLNSMEEYTEVNFARGKLGSGQIKNACDYLRALPARENGQKVIVCLHHHPFLFPDEGVLKHIGEKVGHCLKDSANFLKEIRNQGVDILLFGHEHRHLAFSGTEINEAYNVPYIFSAGKSTENNWEYKVLKDGTADIPSRTTIADVSDNPYSEDHDALVEKITKKDFEKRKALGLPYGLLGRLIEISDNGGIDGTTIIFSS